MRFHVSIGVVTSGLLMAVALASGGCGASGPAKGLVKGKVTAGGQPVNGGGIVLAPQNVEALPARGTVGPDGTFVVGTDDTDDGAAIGKHTVTYNAPPRTGQENWDGYGTPPPETVSPFEGFVPQQAEIEIKAGVNEITIELVPGPPLGS
jgi:hypothetical protein